MNRTYLDSGGTTAKPRTAEVIRPLIGAYRLLLDGSGVLTVFIHEEGSPLSIRVDPKLDLSDTTPIRELALTARAFGGDLIVYDLDCTELVTSGLGVPYTGAPGNDPALAPVRSLFIDGTVVRPWAKAVTSDAA